MQPTNHLLNSQSQNIKKAIVTKLDLHNGKCRLDSFLSTHLHHSKNQIQELIKNAFVSVNGAITCKNGTMLKAGDCVAITLRENLESRLDSTQPHAILPNDSRFKIDILYEDSEVLVINKPPHLIIHEAPSVKEPTLTAWLATHYKGIQSLSGKERFGIIHRLDKQTSGALTIAKSLLAYQNLPKQLKSRQMGRYYLAVIDKPLKENLDIRCFMGRNPHNRLKMSKIHIRDEANIPRGVRDSHSSFAKIALSNNGTLELIAAKLHTGRTHQIRAHLESISRHILGDSLYGYKNNAKIYEGRILLHAYILYFAHPRSGEMMYFHAPILQDMLQFLTTHFSKGHIYDEKHSIMESLSMERILRSFT